MEEGDVGGRWRREGGTFKDIQLLLSSRLSKDRCEGKYQLPVENSEKSTIKMY